MGNRYHLYPTKGRLLDSDMPQVIFDYRKINPQKPELSFPAADIEILGKDGRLRLFTLYVDSGAAITILTASDATRLGLVLIDGESTRLFGIGGSVKAYIHKLEIKLGQSRNKILIAFSVSNQTPRLLGRRELFNKFVISFRESVLKTYFTPEPTKLVRL